MDTIGSNKIRILTWLGKDSNQKVKDFCLSRTLPMVNTSPNDRVELLIEFKIPIKVHTRVSDI